MNEEERKVPSGWAGTEVRRKAAELFEAGFGHIIAARRLGLPKSTVREWRREFLRGRFHVERSPNVAVYSDEIREKAVRLRLSGKTWREITEETGVPAATVRRQFPPKRYTESLKARLTG